jgi:hypothetical protein
MYTRSWHVIKDEKTHTFEVVGQAPNDNAFSNKTIAMQRDGMNVSSVILPVGSKFASKESIKMIGYTREDGLYDRLLKQHQEITRKQADLWDID